MIRNEKEIYPAWTSTNLSPICDHILHDWVLFMNSQGVVRVSGVDSRSAKTMQVSNPLSAIDTTTRVVMTVNGTKYGLMGDTPQPELAIEAWHQWCVKEFVPFYSTDAIHPELAAGQEFRYLSDAGGEFC